MTSCRSDSTERSSPPWISDGCASRRKRSIAAPRASTGSFVLIQCKMVPASRAMRAARSAGSRRQRWNRFCSTSAKKALLVPTASVSDHCRACATAALSPLHARTGRVEAEAVDAAAPDPAAIRVFTRGRAEYTRDEGRGLHRREQLRGAARRRQEHGAVADKEWAMLTAGIGGIRVDLDRRADQCGVRVRDLACCRFGVEGERIGWGQASRRSVQPVAGEDVQPDDGLPQYVRRDLQHGVQQQGLDCEKAGAEERRADRHARIPRRQVHKHGWGQDALIVDPWPEIGIVAR